MHEIYIKLNDFVNRVTRLILLLFIEPSNFFLIGRRSNFEISDRDVIAADYIIIVSRILKVTGNYVKFARFVLLPVSDEAKT